MPVGEGWEPPAAVRDAVEFHWFHVQPGRAVVLCVLSGQPLWYVGHFQNGRMGPCRPAGCESCAKGIGRQLRYVVSCVELSSRQLGVLEVSSSVAELLKQWSLSAGGLRGLIVEIEKASRSKHSRMEASWVHETPPAWVMAMAPLDLKEVLARTWERIEG